MPFLSTTNTPIARTRAPAAPAPDPRQAPVLRSDSHLPAIAATALTTAALRQRFQHPPVWLPELVIEPRLPSSSRPLAEAAVLIALLQQPHGWNVLLTERASTLAVHSGQVALPGGRRDAGDANAAACALREAEEEIGLQRQQVEVLGTLATYTTGSAFVITPVVALVKLPDAQPLQLQANPAEVAAIFEVPLAHLMNPANHRHHAVQWEGQLRHWLSMPYLDEAAGQERYIWGATAAMLRNLYRFLSAPAKGF